MCSGEGGDSSSSCSVFFWFFGFFVFAAGLPVVTLSSVLGPSGDDSEENLPGSVSSDSRLDPEAAPVQYQTCSRFEKHVLNSNLKHAVLNCLRDLFGQDGRALLAVLEALTLVEAARGQRETKTAAPEC